MARFIFLLSFLCLFGFLSRTIANTTGNVFCYYDSRAHTRETQGKMLPSDLDPALSFCNFLVYGYAGINIDNNKLVSLNENLDLDQGHANFRVVTQLKRKFPYLKVLLSVGGDAEKEEEGVYKYNNLLESPAARAAFISSSSVLLKNYGFDGIDLAWQFPKIKPKRVRSKIGHAWHGFKQFFTGKSIVDEKSEEHKEQFSKFILEFKNALHHDNMLLTTSVLPNVNASLYYDTNALQPNLDFVIVDAYDFSTPDRDPYEADFTAPLYEKRRPELHVSHQVDYWLRNHFPASKVIVGIPTYGRAWKLTSDSSIAGVPPIVTDGAAPEGHYSKTPGMLSYPEICSKLANPNNRQGIHDHLRKVTDPSKRFGTYAFRVPDDNGDNGIWISYEDPDTVANRAGFVKAKNLAGIALIDLSMDDFRGLCSGDKFPILRAAKYRL